MFIPVVATFGCLFHGVQGLCVKCQSTLQLFLMLFSVWHLSIIIDGHASSDQLPGPMLVKVHCFSCLGLIWVSWVGWHCVSSLCCVCVAHDVCVVLSSSSVFLVFLLCDNGRKGYHSYFITTLQTSADAPKFI